jgi:hypothetical protein
MRNTERHRAEVGIQKERKGESEKRDWMTQRKTRTGKLGR